MGESLFSFGIIIRVTPEEIVVAGEGPLDIVIAFVRIADRPDESYRFSKLVEVGPLSEKLLGRTSAVVICSEEALDDRFWVASPREQAASKYNVITIVIKM